MPDKAQQHAALLDDLTAERQSLVDAVAGVDLTQATPAEGWSIHDTISHLWSTDEGALEALVNPDHFRDTILASAITDPDGFVDASVVDRRDLDRSSLLASWDRSFEQLVTALASADLGSKVIWFGPPMSPTSFATARLMEYWAHGQDVFDALGLEPEPTDRLRHICHLGHRTRAFSYLLHGMQMPADEVGVRLELPSGAVYEASPEAAQQVIGSAQDFCLVATQRRRPAQTALVATGPAAEEWLTIAQCFAGPPGKGR